MNSTKWSRRNFLKSLAAGGLACSLPPLWNYSASRDTRPNVLVLFTDDQRFDTIRALGNQHIHTPHLDSLVESGTAFTRAYIMGSFSGAVCMPSRAMLLTGKSLFDLQEQGGVIPDEHTMLPELFRNSGYVTHGTGKWHNGRSAFARCFAGGGEIFFGGMSDHWNVPAYAFDPAGKYQARTPVIQNPASSNTITYKGYEHISDGLHSSELFSREAGSFLENYSGTAPFFLYVSYTAPHDPRTMPKSYLDMYDPKDIPLPENFLPLHPFDNGELSIRDEMLAEFPRTEQEIRRHIAEYYAAITHLDDQIGTVLEALRRSDRSDNTLIVFAADNGLALGSHGLMGKQNLYDHSLHVPLILCGPGIPSGSRQDSPCYLNDVFPTLCDLVELNPPSDILGQSLLPVLKNRQTNPRRSLMFAYKDIQRALVDGRWKLILYHVRGTSTTQLFDLDKDPFEKENLAGNPEYAGRVAELSQRLQESLRAAGDEARESFQKADGKRPLPEARSR